MNITFSTGTASEMGKADKKIADWEKIVKVLTTHKQSENKAASWFVGGYFKGSRRVDDELVARTMLTLDIDDSELSLADIEYELRMGIEACFVAYSTFSHAPGHPRIRVVVPLANEVTGKQYRALSTNFCANLNLKVDFCSFKPNQFMYLPVCPDLSIAWAIKQDGEPLAIDFNALDGIDAGEGVGSDDLDIIIANSPLDITDEEVDAYLLAYPPQHLDYDAWLKVGMALYHQYSGSKDGLQKWGKWSAQDSERFDKK